MQSGKEFYRTAEKRKSEYVVKTEWAGTEETWLQQRLKKAAMKERTLARVRYNLCFDRAAYAVLGEGKVEGVGFVG